MKRIISFLAILLCVATINTVFAQSVSLVYDINNTNKGSSPTDFISFNNKLYFLANDGIHSEELWVYDGINPAYMITDNYSYSSHTSEPLRNIVCNNKLYFRASNGINGYELWEYDRLSDPRMIADICPGSCSSLPVISYYAGTYLYYLGDYTAYNNLLFFGATTESFHAPVLYTYDGINPPEKIISPLGNLYYPGN